MTNNSSSRPALLASVAKALNAGGRAVVSVYDTGSGLVEKIFSTVSQATVLPEKAMDLAERLGSVEKWKIEKEIKASRARIKELYYEIGCMEAGLPESAGPSEREPLKRLIAEVREYEQEIGRLKTRLAEIGAAQAGRMPAEADVVKAVQSAIEEGLKSGVFDNPGEKALFERVAKDLLDNNLGVRLLAVAELGKFGNEACVTVLISAAGFESPELQSEIISILVSIGDKHAVPLLKEKLSSPGYRVRTGCLRGLYRLADEEELLPLLTGALGDSHPDVRVTAATLLGWKGSPAAVEALSLCLKDRDEAVRRAAISALVNIGASAAVLSLIGVLGDRSAEIRQKALEAITSLTGKEIVFDVQVEGKALSGDIDRLIEWWKSESGEDRSEVGIEVEAEAGVADEVESDADEGREQETVQAREEDMEKTDVEAPGAEEEPGIGIPGVEEALASISSEALAEIEEAESAEGEEVVVSEGQDDMDIEVTIAEETEGDSEKEMNLEAVFAEEVKEEPGGEVESPSENKLKKMQRADLITLCKEWGIECDETFTKAEMIKRLTGRK